MPKSATRILLEGKLPEIKADYLKGMSSIKLSEKYIKVVEEEPLKNECKHFIGVVEGNLEPYTNGIEGLKVLKVLSAASLAHKKNEVIKL